jgi:uncharacterized protein (TIRG00374 family)
MVLLQPLRREDAPMARLTKKDLVRIWRPFRIVAGFALLGVAIWVLTGKSSELAGAGAFLSQLRWEWLVLAAVAEFGSYLSITFLERTFLGAGDVRAKLRRLIAIAFAGSAIQSALPVGAAFAGVYEFRQFQLLGADEVLSGWVVIAVGTVAFAALAVLAGIGLSLAATLGSTFDLVEAIIGVLFLALLVVVAWANRGTLYRVLQRAVGRLERLSGRPAGQLTAPLAKGLERMRAVAPTRLEWAQAVLAGTCSWLSDCACLAFAFIAVGAQVPWAGLLLAYCGGQLAVNLPITPGGLGVVEGSLTVALVAFGGGEAPTVAAVLLYRLISFWVPLPVGGGCYLGLVRARRQAVRRSVAAELAEAEETSPGPTGPTGRNKSVAEED